MAADDGVLRVATEGDYPPFSSFDDQGRLVGFDVDIAKALCAVMKARCEIRNHPWVALIPDLNDGKIDIIVASLSITEERKQLVAFTNRYYRTPMQFVARKGHVNDIDPAELTGKRIGVEEATTAEKYARATYGQVADIVARPTMSAVRSEMVTGHLDLMLADSLVMWQFTQTLDGASFEFVGKPIAADEGIGIAVRKADTELLRRLNTAIARIRLDGTYDRINTKYFPFSIY